MLTQNHSLYIHTVDYVEQFNALYLNWSPSLSLDSFTGNEQSNIEIDIFSLWINFVRSHSAPIRKLEKQFTHNFNFSKDSFIHNHPFVQDALAQFNYDPKKCLVFAYFISAKFWPVFLNSFKNNFDFKQLQDAGVLNNEYYLYDEYSLMPNDQFYIVQKRLLVTLLDEFYKKDYKISSIVNASLLEVQYIFDNDVAKIK